LSSCSWSTTETLMAAAIAREYHQKLAIFDWIPSSAAIFWFGLLCRLKLMEDPRRVCDNGMVWY
jgi:hypothetical protein